MADFHFLRPFWLLSIVFIALIWLGFLRRQDERTRLATLIDPHLLTFLLVTPDRQRQLLRPIPLLAVLLTLMSIALAGPSFRQQPSPFTDEQAGLMILLKLSQTMNGEDVQPSRLARAKFKIKDLLDIRKGKNTGLIAYSGSAHLVMPMTKDGRILNIMIEDLSPDLMPTEGDSLAEAITLAQQHINGTHQPGSLLVICDTVTSDIANLSDFHLDLPIQFLAVQPPQTAADPNLRHWAAALGADVTELTADTADVQRISRKATTSLRSVVSLEEGQQWQDAGYWLLPIIAFLSLFWFRKGWVIR